MNEDRQPKRWEEHLMEILGIGSRDDLIEFLNSKPDPALAAEMEGAHPEDELMDALYPYGNPEEMDPEDREALEDQGLKLTNYDLFC